MSILVRPGWSLLMEAKTEGLSYRKLKEGERNLAIIRGFSKQSLSDEDFERGLKDTRKNLSPDATWEEIRIASSSVYQTGDSYLYFFHLPREKGKKLLGVQIIRDATKGAEELLARRHEIHHRKVRFVFIATVGLAPEAILEFRNWSHNWEFWTEEQIILCPNLHLITPTHTRVPESEVADVLSTLGIKDRKKLNVIFDSDSIARVNHWAVFSVIRVFREESFLPTVTTSHYNYRVVLHNTTNPPLQNSLDVDESFNDERQQARMTTI